MLIKHTRVPLSCDTIWSIHPVLDTRTVHIVFRIHHLLFLFNNTNSLLLRRLLWDWLVAPQERWVCTKLPMYVLSTFLLPFCVILLYDIYTREVDTRVLEFVYTEWKGDCRVSSFWGAFSLLKYSLHIDIFMTVMTHHSSSYTWSYAKANEYRSHDDLHMIVCYNDRFSVYLNYYMPFFCMWKFV